MRQAGVNNGIEFDGGEGAQGEVILMRTTAVEAATSANGAEARVSAVIARKKKITSAGAGNRAAKCIAFRYQDHHERRWRCVLF